MAAANHGRLDISTISLAAKYWTFALPRNLHWPTVRKTQPRITEPESRYFIHCIQHWVIRFPRQYANRFRTFALNELDQETILVDNCGQIYRIYVIAGLPDDWGVRWFTLEADASYTPLTLSQIEAVKKVVLPAVDGEEGLPSWKSAEAEMRQAIRAAIQAAEPLAPVELDPLAAEGIYEPVGRKAINPAPPDEPEAKQKRLLAPHTIRQLQQAYIDAQYGRNCEEKEDAMRLLSSYLKQVMPKQFHKRIDCLNRTMLTRKLAKYYVIAFPKSSEKVLPQLTEEEERKAEYNYIMAKYAQCAAPGAPGAVLTAE